MAIWGLRQTRVSRNISVFFAVWCLPLIEFWRPEARVSTKIIEVWGARGLPQTRINNNIIEILVIWGPPSDQGKHEYY